MKQGVFTKVAFTAISFANIFQGLVVFLPAFASAIGLSSTQGTTILSLKNVAAFIRMVSLGYLAERYNALFLASIASLLAGLAAFLWGFAKSFHTLLLFSICSGLFESPYSVLYSRFATSLTDDAPSRTWIYSLLEYQRDALVIARGVFSGGLVSGETNLKAYGVERYKKLILLEGSSFCVSAMTGTGNWAWERRLVFAWPVKMVHLLKEGDQIGEGKMAREGEERRRYLPPELPALELPTNPMRPPY